MPERTSNLNRWIWGGILCLFFVIYGILVATPINDNDFFWHLTTGRWIWEHKVIPSEDPLNFTTPRDAGQTYLKTRFRLQQYWLGQLLIYGVYRIGEYYGIVLFRSVLFLLTIFFLYYWLTKMGTKSHAVLLLLVPAAFVLGEFVGERPNQISFFMAVITLYLVEETRRLSRKAFFLPVVMFIWANAHGGFILGAVTIVLYLASETAIKFNLKYAKKQYDGYQYILLVYSLSLFAGFLNPQGYNAIPVMLEANPLHYQPISESQSPFELARTANIDLYSGFFVFYLVASIVYAALTVRRRQTDLAHLALLSFLLLLSSQEIRYLPFLGLLATPILAGSLTGPAARLFARLERFGIPQVFFCLLFLASFSLEYKNTILKQPVLSDNFPVRAVDFLKEELIEGKIFNFVDYGGYLDWRFYPEKRTFIDGRNLVNSVFVSHDNVIRGLSGWDAVLESYDVRHIIIPAVMRNGGMPGLIPELYLDDRWKLVYGDSSGLLFSIDERMEGRPKSLMFAYVITAADKQAGSDNP
ncbi:MAG TPA: hypothetical protein VN328_03450, partial [Thermodesulfovibrionales bacterium]|nr:hypothetical protein [Thermodesulfovibrionales bacterium]